MRLFYEAWNILDFNSSVATDELQDVDNKIDIYHTMRVPNLKYFPVEDFFRVPFTHHTSIRAKVKDLEARYYYIHRTAEENLSVDELERLIKDDAYGHRKQMPSNFQHTIPNATAMRKAVMMFKDSYLLDAMVVIELKTGEFKTAYLGQLMGYLTILDEKIRKPQVLCV